MKLKVLVISLLILAGNLIYAQNSDYAIIYLNRLKKSTGSNIDYKVWVGDKFIGTLYGTSPVFTYKYYGGWMVFVVDVKNNVPIKITEGKKNKLKAVLMLNIKKDEKYFLTFNSAAEYNQISLKLIENKKGLLALNKSEIEDIEIKDRWIKQIVLNDRKKGLIVGENAVNITKAVSKNSGSSSILVKNNNETMLNDFLESIKNKNAEKYLKTGKFDSFKSYYYDPSIDSDLLDDIKISLKDINKDDSVIIYYSEKDKRIYVAINYSK